MKEKFIEFLKKNKAYDKYMRNLDPLIPFETIAMDQPAADWLLSAFDCENTPQGRKYWLEIHLKWEKELQTIK